MSIDFGWIVRDNDGMIQIVYCVDKMDEHLIVNGILRYGMYCPTSRIIYLAHDAPWEVYLHEWLHARVHQIIPAWLYRRPIWERIEESIISWFVY